MSFLRLSIIGLITVMVAFAAYGRNPVAPNDGYADQEEINQSFELNQGASVKINSINGSVKVETWDQAKAEIHIVKRTNEGPDNDWFACTTT